MIEMSLADNLSYNSSSDFSTTAFASVRKKAKKQNINVSSDNAELHKMPFSMEELHDALRNAHDNSAGPDEIHYTGVGSGGGGGKGGMCRPPHVFDWGGGGNGMFVPPHF